MTKKSLQDTYAPHNACFGCGPSNDKGLRIKSFVSDDGQKVVAEFQPEPHHEAFPGVLNGGIIGSLLDCHCNWTAAYFLMKKTDADSPPCTVTADYKISLKRPTPTNQPIQLVATPIEISGNKVKVYGELIVNGKVCDTCEGTFVAVTEGHPAYHRW